MIFRAIIIVCCFLSISPQIVYSQLLNKEAKWTIKNALYGEERNVNYFDLQIEKDSVINDTIYSIFNFQSNICALREDGHRVYYKVLNNKKLYGSKECLLYDFNLNFNDTIHLKIPPNNEYASEDWLVKGVDSILVGNSYKRRILLEVLPINPDFGIQYWIEDIGSTFGPLYFTGISEHEIEVELNCYSLANEILFGDCSTVGLSNSRNDLETSISYDPLTNQLNLELTSSEDCLLNIYSLNGFRVFSKHFQICEPLNLSSLRTGLYIVELKTDRFRYCEKLYFH